MPKIETFAAADSALATATATPRVLRLGDQVQVLVAADTVLPNNETGGLFAAGVPTLQTVSVTLLRRLADGDLTLL